MKRFLPSIFRRPLVVLLCGAGLAGPPATSAQERVAPAEAALRLSVDDAVRLALEHNLDLAVARVDPQIGDAGIAQALATYVPTFSTSAQRNNQTTPPSSFLVGQQGILTSTYSSTIGVSQVLPWLGASYSVAWDSSRATTASPFTNFNPSLGSTLFVSFSQPLLRDFSIDSARRQLIVSRRNREIADVDYREAQVQTTAEVRRAYWDLVSARAAVTVAHKSLELARELEHNNRVRVEVGDLPPLDLVSARAEVAQREEQLLVAQTSVRQSEDALRVLILDPDAPDFWTTRLEPTETVPEVTPPPEVAAAIARGLERRTDLARARKQAENAATTVEFQANQRLPDLRLQASFVGDGVGGNRLLRTGGFPGAIVGFEHTGFGNVLSQVLTGDFPTWAVGLSINYPIGRSFEEASLARARLEAQQARDRVRSLELRVARELRSTALNLETEAKRIESTRATRELAEQRLDAEQKRFEVGMSTSFLVVQAQRDLAEARNNELNALLAYERAKIDFETLQEAGPPSGAVAAAGDAAAPAGQAITANPAAQAASAARNARGGFRW